MWARIISSCVSISLSVSSARFVNTIFQIIDTIVGAINSCGRFSDIAATKLTVFNASFDEIARWHRAPSKRRCPSSSPRGRDSWWPSAIRSRMTTAIGDPGSCFMKAASGPRINASDDRSVSSTASSSESTRRMATLFDHRLEQLLLGLEVQVQQPLTDTGELRDFLDARPGIALFREHLETPHR